MLKAHDLLAQARETMLERSVERDVEEERAMLPTIRIFAAMCGVELTEYQGWMFMVCLKMARAHGGKFRADDYVDMASYIALAAECRDETAAPSPLMDIIKEGTIIPHGTTVSAATISNTATERSKAYEADPLRPWNQ